MSGGERARKRRRYRPGGRHAHARSPPPRAPSCRPEPRTRTRTQNQTQYYCPLSHPSHHIPPPFPYGSEPPPVSARQCPRPPLRPGGSGTSVNGSSIMHGPTDTPACRQPTPHPTPQTFILSFGQAGHSIAILVSHSLHSYSFLGHIN
ncbi:hypothetical protein DACRYDRAFT_118920 [Dacryopinax primogenitus]|uniref:Uncharacterized protein n=1 Tax=Dacryopinax primogenitus (strain DJM 731) TaxID=1858805 RepID=M5FXI5_DACPD|nr:uncharacterized protein DACRYDRAFT_118920 [Dacryopinax primogenitus]EJT98191.1 hypothetical protein DACRYDRAFT_118920 [Dacryopinax primogenitus]